MVVDKNREIDLLTRTILGEAAGEDAYGQAAVGAVIRNRTRDSRWGGSYENVVLAPKQFSAWNSGAGGNDPSKWDPNSEAYKRTRRIAEGIYNGEIEDKTGGATHYYSPSGMDALVREGSQSNTIPRWLQEETDRRGGQTYQHGGHIFTGKAEDPVLSVSTKGEGLGATDPYAPENAIRGPDGALSNAFLTGMAGKAIDRGGMNPADGSNPDWYFEGGGAGGGQSRVSSQGGSGEEGALDQSNVGPEAAGPAPKFGQKGWLNKDRSQQLLAIGAGLLSGDDWNSGIAAASENLMGVNASIQDVKNAAIEDQRNQDQALERINAQSSGSGASGKAAGNMEMSDGSFVGNLIEQGGRFFTPDGTDVSANVAGKRNNSDVYGSKGQMTPTFAQKEQSWIVNTGSSLGAFDRTIETVDTMKFGVEGFAQTMEMAAKSFLGMGLSPEEIKRRVAEGDLQGLIGQSREQVVGPGVMTEQDAMRIVAYLGGDINDILANPDAALERLKIGRTNMLSEYTVRADQYDAQIKKFPQLPYIPLNRYVPKTAAPPPAAGGEGALDSSNLADPEAPDGDIAIAQQLGFSPEEWAELTPEEKASLK